MHDPNLVHTELYELFDKKTSKLLGICHLNFKVEGNENLEKHLKLTINLKVWVLFRCRTSVIVEIE